MSIARWHSRAAGALYLVTHVTSVTAVMAYGAGAIPAGVTLEFALAIGCVGTGVLLWWLLKGRGPVRALTFAVLRAVEAAVIITGALPMLALTWISAPGAAVSEAAQQFHAASFLLGQGLIISINTIVLAWVLWDARATPRALALVGGIGGIVVLLSNLAQLWSVIPLSGGVAGVAAVPIFAFEIWLAFYLIIVGVGPSEGGAGTE